MNDENKTQKETPGASLHSDGENKTQKEIPGASLHSDDPIRSGKEDQLARGKLVEVVGRCIQTTDSPASIVIALNAPWGAGKSSFLNLLEECLSPEKTTNEGPTVPVPIIIRFNPWNYGNIEQLVQMFFAQLARGIGKDTNKELTKRISELLDAASGFVSFFSSKTGSALKAASKIMAPEKGLPELRAELDNLLSLLKRRVVVLIDDIDRLERDALRLLFRMIRLNANFPNITYVLAFDRLVVEQSLDEENGIRGRDYLEKIIQVPFDIPEPEPETMQRIFFEEMDALLSLLKTQPLDQHRWSNLFHSGFKEHFRTIRNIKRYCNGLYLTLTPVAEEVDLADFLAIELIRQFHPEVHSGIVQGKDMLAPKQTELSEKMPEEQLRKWTEALCKKASLASQVHVKGILRELFPELGRIYENTYYEASSHIFWRKACRVCSPDVFDKFFLLAVPSREVSEVEILGFVESLADVKATTATLKQGLNSGKARRLLERLEDFTDELPPEHVAPLVSVLFELGDTLRFEPQGMLDVNADLQVARIIYRSLRRLESEEDRYDLLLKSIQDGEALYTAVQTVRLLDPKEWKLEDLPIFDHSRWEALREAAVARILAAEEEGSLWTLNELSYVLNSWSVWSTEEKVRDAVAARVEEEARLLGFLGRFKSKSRSHTIGDKVARVHWKIERTALRKLVDLDAITERLKGIASYGGEHASIASEFLALLEAKSEFPWGE